MSFSKEPEITLKFHFSVTSECVHSKSKRPVITLDTVSNPSIEQKNLNCRKRKMLTPKCYVKRRVANTVSKTNDDIKIEKIKSIPSTSNKEEKEWESKIIAQALKLFPSELVSKFAKKGFTSLQGLCNNILDYQNDNIDKVICKICMDKEKDIVFLPCCHFVTCFNCARSFSDCSICRQSIHHKMKIYNS